MGLPDPSTWAYSYADADGFECTECGKERKSLRGSVVCHGGPVRAIYHEEREKA